MTNTQDAKAVNDHYGRQDLSAVILDALRAVIKEPNQLTYDALAPVDQFHIRGKESTLELARLASLRGELKVLDVGGGLGGAARTLAAEFGCHVTVLDITEEYCRVGEMLTASTRFSDRVSFKQGSAQEIPFPDQSFDVVWTQHSSMNIPNKEQFYSESHRVLRSGGRLAFHEIFAGSVQPIHFPVPWAPSDAISFLRSVEAMRTLIAEAGFDEVAWVDVSKLSRDWYRQRLSEVVDGEPPLLGLQLLLGKKFGPAFKNQIRNLEEERIAVVEAVFERV